MRKIATVLFLTTSLAACGESQHALTNEEQATAELGARRAMATVQTCSGLDSDNDGYVTCSGKNADGSPASMVCSYRKGAAGCKSK